MADVYASRAMVLALDVLKRNPLLRRAGLEAADLLGAAYATLVACTLETATPEPAMRVTATVERRRDAAVPVPPLHKYAAASWRTRPAPSRTEMTVTPGRGRMVISADVFATVWAIARMRLNAEAMAMTGRRLDRSGGRRRWVAAAPLHYAAAPRASGRQRAGQCVDGVARRRGSRVNRD